jgi:hypothetical protein
MTTPPYLGHLVRVSALTYQAEYPLIQVRVQLIYDPADLDGIGIFYYTNDDDTGDVIWLDELQSYRYATVRCNAINYSDALVSVVRGQHDIKVDFGGFLEQLVAEDAKKRLYGFVDFRITPTEEEGVPKLTSTVAETMPGTIDYIDGQYGQSIWDSPVFEATGEEAMATIADTLVVSLQAGGSLIYSAYSVQKIGANYYLYYAPP